MEAALQPQCDVTEAPQTAEELQVKETFPTAPAQAWKAVVLRAVGGQVYPLKVVVLQPQALVTVDGQTPVPVEGHVNETVPGTPPAQACEAVPLATVVGQV